MARSDKRTWRDVEEEVYSDFDIAFGKNPVTGALVRVTNDESIRQAVRNVVLTVVGEWPHHPNVGSKVYMLLFDPLDPVTAQMIRDAIAAALRRETRINLIDVFVKTNYASDGYDLTIAFTVLNRTEPVEFSLFLKRAR